MSCEICGRSSCTRSFHSLDEQERYDLRQEMSDNVDILREELQDVQGELKQREQENENMREDITQALMFMRKFDDSIALDILGKWELKGGEG